MEDGIQNIVDYVSPCHPVFVFPYVPLPILERLFRPSGSLELFDYPCPPFNGGVLRDACRGNLATGYYKRSSFWRRLGKANINICHVFLSDWHYLLPCCLYLSIYRILRAANDGLNFFIGSFRYQLA